MPAPWNGGLARAIDVHTLRAATPRMDVKFPILGFLMESEMTGYDLKRIFQDSVGVFYRASDGSLYPALAKLERRKLVKMRVARRGRRARKVYSLTAAGRTLFLRMLREPSPPTFVHDEAQIKMFFAHHSPGSGMEHLMRMLRQDQEKAALLAKMKTEIDRTEPDPFRRMFVEVGARITAFKAAMMTDLAAKLRRELKLKSARNGHRSRIRLAAGIK